MPAIRSEVIVDSEPFRANRAAHLALIAEFRALEEKVREASGRSDAKFRQRGQLPPRERVNLILDRDAPFLELSSLCGLGMHEDDGKENVYGGGSIVGIGMISGARCMVTASDSGIKGGAAHPMGVEKAIRAQEIALQNKLPLVQLVESAGANLLLQAEMFVRGGATFANMARLSAAGIPVISIVHGSSTAGGAYQTGLADYVVMVRGTLEGLSGGAAAAEGRDRRDRRRRGARRRRTAHVDDGPRRISRRERFRRASDRARDSRQARLGAARDASRRAAAALRSGGTARRRARRLPQAL